MNFEKVSYLEYSSSICGDADLQEEYDAIILPERATKYSAGYDIHTPFSFSLYPGESIKIPTGVRVLLDPDKFLAIFPRSGMGFKYQVGLANTVGIIDADYSGGDNQGHIYVKLVNRGDKEIVVNRGDGIAQGIIQQYFITEDDAASGLRNGGFGSTGK